MPIVTYLAMTAAEARAFHTDHMGWMSCLFSPYATGITNLPDSLPPESLLILSDLMPIQGHDPVLVAQQLTQCVQQLNCCGVLLDFQRPDNPQAQAMAQALCTLPFPVGVSHLYASGLSCPVFLPPCPPHQAAADHLLPWKDRPIWLELSTEQICLTVTQDGCSEHPLCDEEALPYRCPELSCHFAQNYSPEKATFRLGRTEEDLNALLDQAEKFGVTKAIGLFQEFAKH